MTDHKFTEEQIIEALEIRMPHDAVCREASALINRQKADIKRLEKSLADQFDSYENIRKKAKTEAIKEFAQRLIDKCTDPHWCVWMNEIEDLVTEMTENKR